MSASFLLGLPHMAKTLLDRFTESRAQNLDKIDATLSSRAPASSALSTDIWTNELAARINEYASKPYKFLPKYTHYVEKRSTNGVLEFSHTGPCLIAYLIAADVNSSFYIDWSAKIDGVTVVNRTGIGPFQSVNLISIGSAQMYPSTFPFLKASQSLEISVSSTLQCTISSGYLYL